VAARAINSFNDITHPQSDTYFRDWDFFPVCFPKMLLGMAKRQGLVETSEGGGVAAKAGKVWTGKIHGVEIGWVDYDQWCEGPWIRNATEDQATASLGRLAWETMGPAIKLESTLAGDTLSADHFTASLPSQTADAIYAKTKLFTDAGHTRSVLLYGESGVGKSHIMRYVAQKAGGFSLRVKARQLQHLQDISRAIMLLKPSAVLIDDLDRLEDPDQILSEIEEIKGSAKLFLCSVNRINRLDPAVLRANRFDELIEVASLDDAVLNALIGEDVPEPIAQQLRALPVVWVDEFHKRRAILGDAQAIADVQDLQRRADMIKQMMDDGDWSKESNKAPSSPPRSR